MSYNVVWTDHKRYAKLTRLTIQAIAKPALEALINLSPSPAVARHLTTAPFLTFLISYTCNTTSILSSLTSMLLSNISSHHSLLPSLASLSIPLVPFSNPSKIPPPSHSSGDDSQAAESAAVGKAERVEPGWYLPEGLSASSTVHRDYRDPAICPPNKEAGQGEERQVEAIRALVQAFEDGAAGGVKEGKGKRKGECHFLASVFANISTVSLALGLCFRAAIQVWRAESGGTQSRGRGILDMEIRRCAIG